MKKFKFKINKYNQLLKNKKFKEFKDYISKGLTIEEWRYVENSKETADLYQKLMKSELKTKQHFQECYFYEKPLRVRKKLYRELSNRIKKGNGYFDTHHYEDGDHTWMDICFLSKKHPYMFYNVVVETSSIDISDNLDMKYFYMFNNKDLNHFGNTPEIIEANKKEYTELEIDFEQKPTTFTIDKKYRYGIGLTISLNNGKQTFDKQDIIQAIQTFWDKGEIDFSLPLNDNQMKKEELIKESLSSIVIMEGMKNLGEIKHKKEKALVKELIAKNLLTQDHYDNKYHYSIRKSLEERKWSDKLYKELYETLEKEERYKTLHKNYNEVCQKYVSFHQEIKENVFVRKEKSDFVKQFTEKAYQHSNVLNEQLAYIHNNIKKYIEDNLKDKI